MLYTKVYYESISCFGMDSSAKALLAMLRIPDQRPLLHRVVQAYHKVCHKVCHMYDTNSVANPLSIEQDTQHISFLINK
jgi:hypothetical protein